jgi:hypothetical protein
MSLRTIFGCTAACCLLLVCYGNAVSRKPRMFARSIPLVFCYVLVFCTQSAFSALTIEMTGTIGSGTLNGASIDGERFTVNAEIANGVDLEPRDIHGHFALSQATMHIGTSNLFDFDPSTTFYAQQLGVTTQFGAGFVTPIGQPTEAFGYTQTEAITFPFDPNIIQPLSYSSFNDTVAVGSLGGAVNFTNGSNSLVISSLSLSEASFTAVPEPNAVSLLGLGVVVGFLRRTRRMI